MSESDRFTALGSIKEEHYGIIKNYAPTKSEQRLLSAEDDIKINDENVKGATQQNTSQKFAQS